jgi:hypothetical protein
MCSDSGLILSTIEIKRQKLNVIEELMKFAGLNRAYAHPQGIELNYVPTCVATESFFTRD